MSWTFEDSFYMDYPDMRGNVTNIRKGCRNELIVDTTDGRRYSYDILEHTLLRLPIGRITDSDFKLIFGAKLRRALSSRFISQQDFANSLGITPMAVSRYISGKRMPTYVQIYNMTKILNCSLRELIYTENDF